MKNLDHPREVPRSFSQANKHICLECPLPRCREQSMKCPLQQAYRKQYQERPSDYPHQ